MEAGMSLLSNNEARLTELDVADQMAVCGGGTVPIYDTRRNAIVGMDTGMIVNYLGHHEALSTVLDNFQCGADIAAAVASDGAIAWFDGTTMVLDCGTAAYDDWQAMAPAINNFIQQAEAMVAAAVGAVSNMMFCPSSMDEGSWSTNSFNPYCT